MSSFPWQAHSIDSLRPIRVLIIGAGPSGITSAIRLLQGIPHVSLTIYDKNSDFGGTWFETRYPGVGADIPALSYQLTFEPNRGWSSMYPPGKEICEYWQGVARKYGLYEDSRLGHRVTRLEWDEERGKWRLWAETDSGEEILDEGEWTFCCLGQYNNWKWPDIPDRDKYQGELMHSAKFNTSYSLSGKRIALIGSGSSAVQMLPQIQPLASHIDIYIRNQMWLSPPFGADYILSRNPELAATNFVLPPALRNRFMQDDEFYWDWRKGMEKCMNSLHEVTLLDSPLQAMFRSFLTQDMKDKLAKKPEIYQHLLPSFPVCSRRVTPGNAFLEALVQDNVSFHPEEIAHFTPEGLTTATGEQHSYDAIICATGYDGTFRPPFPVLGQGGLDLRTKLTDPPSSYLSLALDSFPNLLLFGGPNSEVGTSHNLIVIETVATYAAQCVRKAQFEQIKAMAPSAHAVSEFSKYVACYFSNGRTVYGEGGCRSGYRNGRAEGVSSALWPGSVLHLMRSLREPRWQDWEYRYSDQEDGMFAYLGDGWTEAEKVGGDVAYYLDEIDVPKKASAGGI